jgi:hypothetical protein
MYNPISHQISHRKLCVSSPISGQINYLEY